VVVVLRDRKREKRESVGKNFEGVSLKDVWNCAWILEVEENFDHCQ